MHCAEVGHAKRTNVKKEGEPDMKTWLKAVTVLLAVLAISPVAILPVQAEVYGYVRSIGRT